MTIENELVALTSEDGFIRPATVVEWARSNPDSNLHGQFEWDDAKAADKYRLDQARRLIAVHVRTDDGSRATISLIQDRNPDGGYRHIGPVLKNAELRAMAIRQALRDFRRWESRYKHLKELAVVFEAANGVALPEAPEEAA